MQNTEKKLSLEVADDGQGCDLQSLSRGFGLRGIKERIKSLEGEVLLESTQGAGMKVSAWIPLA